MKTLLLLATLTLLASCTKPPAVTPSPEPETQKIEKTTANDDVMMKPDEVKPDTMMKSDNMNKEILEATGSDTIQQDESAMIKPTGYMNYDATKVSEALASGQKVALFFHATWCPSCKALDSTINTEASTIPSDALIVKVDYDTSTEMKQKYGVINQHTIVLIDKEMNLISKKLGAKNVAEVLN